MAVDKLRHNIVKVAVEPRAASGSTVNFDNVMTKFIINKRTDAQKKTDVNLFFTITRPQKWSNARNK